MTEYNPFTFNSQWFARSVTLENKLRALIAAVEAGNFRQGKPTCLLCGEPAPPHTKECPCNIEDLL